MPVRCFAQPRPSSSPQRTPGRLTTRCSGLATLAAELDIVSRPKSMCGRCFSKARRFIVCLVVVSALAGQAHGEVADKLWSLPALLGPAFVSALLAIVLVPRSLWWCLIMLPLGLYRVSSAAAELLDVHIGPAIRHEVGAAYLARVVAAVFVVLAGHGLAVYLRRRPTCSPKMSHSGCESSG